jgi:hypothetical protein
MNKENKITGRLPFFCYEASEINCWLADPVCRDDASEARTQNKRTAAKAIDIMQVGLIQKTRRMAIPTARMAGYFFDHRQ